MSDEQYTKITQAWDALAIPVRTPDETDDHYIDRLISLAKDLSAKANVMEASAQKFATSNVNLQRQIMSLNEELARYAHVRELAKQLVELSV